MSDSMPRRKNWEIYSEMVVRLAQGQALTAQELDLRNFFQRIKIPFWFHPVWKAIEDQCFYVYDFALRIIQSAEPSNSSLLSLGPFISLNPDLWLLECSYTAAKPGFAKQYLRKRCPVFDRKFRAAKRRGIKTILLLEALHVPPPVLSQSLPTLEYADLLFTSVDTLKGWVLDHLELNKIRQGPTTVASPERSKQKQVQSNGFLEGW